GQGAALRAGHGARDGRGRGVSDIHEPVHQAGAEFRDARTGRAIWTKPTTSGTEGPGRGVSDDIWAGNRGAESWAVGGGVSGLFDRYGNNLGRAPGSRKFLGWGPGHPVRPLLRGNHSDKYGRTAQTPPPTATGG